MQLCNETFPYGLWPVPLQLLMAFLQTQGNGVFAKKDVDAAFIVRSLKPLCSEDRVAY